MKYVDWKLYPPLRHSTHNNRSRMKVEGGHSPLKHFPAYWSIISIKIFFFKHNCSAQHYLYLSKSLQQIWNICSTINLHSKMPKASQSKIKWSTVSSSLPQVHIQFCHSMLSCPVQVFPQTTVFLDLVTPELPALLLSSVAYVLL